jgi:hypothetical protein
MADFANKLRYYTFGTTTCLAFMLLLGSLICADESSQKQVPNPSNRRELSVSPKLDAGKRKLSVEEPLDTELDKIIDEIRVQREKAKTTARSNEQTQLDELQREKKAEDEAKIFGLILKGIQNWLCGQIDLGRCVQLLKGQCGEIPSKRCMLAFANEHHKPR